MGHYLNTIYDMVMVIKGITLFLTPSKGAKYTPNLILFHEYLEEGTNKDDTTIKQFVSSIAKTFHSATDEKAKEPPRRLRSLI